MPPWDRYQQAPQGAQAPTQAPVQAPRTIGGTRTLGGVPASETRAQQDQVMQQEAARRAAEAAERAAANSDTANALARERLDMAQAGEQRSATNDQRGTADQNRAAGFMRRAISANENFGQVAVAPRGTIGQLAQEAAPNLMNEFWNSGDRQLADQAEREFVMAVLRYDSGAAIPDPELNSSADMYFPRPGNTPEVIAQKAEARRVAIEGLLQSSGVAGERAAREMNWNQPAPESTPFNRPATQSGAPPAQGGSTPPRPNPPPSGARTPTEQDIYRNGVEFGMDGGGPDQSFDRNAYLSEQLGIGSGQEDLAVGFANANSGNQQLTEQDVRAFYEQNRIPLPAPEELAAFVEEMRTSPRGTTWGGIDTTAPQKSYEDNLDTALERRGFNPESQGESGLRGIAHGVTLTGLDELTGLTAAVGADNPIMAYQTERDIQRRIDERSSDENPWTYGGGNVLGGAATGGATIMARGANTVRQAARIGAVEGGVAGFNSGEGMGGSLGGAAVGAVGGAALGGGIQYAAPKIGNALSNLRPARPSQTNALATREGVEAAQRLDVPVRGPDMNPDLRPRRAEILQGPNGQQIRDADAQDLEAMEAAIQRNLGASGAEPDRFGLGDAVQGAVKGVRERTRQRAGLEYTRATRRSGDVRATPERALASIDENIAELVRNGENQNNKAITFLRGVREDLARDGGMGIEALRSQRTGLASTLKAEGLDATDLERRMTGVHDALAEDITGALRNTPEALAGFRKADQMWRSQAEFGERIVRQIVGTRNAPVAAADAARRVESFFQKDFGRARRLMAELDEGQRAQISEHLADSLGRNRNGQFSMAEFLRHTSRGKGALMDERSMRLAFGERGMSAIQDLRAIATMKQAAQSQTNRSNTGGVVAAGQRNLRTVVLSALGFTGGGPAGAIAAPMAVNALSALGEQRAVRLLLNPDVTKWLRQIPPTSSPKAINTSFARLRSVANRTPGMMADVQALERWIVDVANGNSASVTGAAAQPQDQQGQ